MLDVVVFPLGRQTVVGEDVPSFFHVNHNSFTFQHEHSRTDEGTREPKAH
jgi:hypothetical protein